jgi:hypothetical protein
MLTDGQRMQLFCKNYLNYGLYLDIISCPPFKSTYAPVSSTHKGRRLARKLVHKKPVISIPVLAFENYR